MLVLDGIVMVGALTQNRKVVVDTELTMVLVDIMTLYHMVFDVECGFLVG